MIMHYIRHFNNLMWKWVAGKNPDLWKHLILLGIKFFDAVKKK